MLKPEVVAPFSTQIRSKLECPESLPSIPTNTNGGSVNAVEKETGCFVIKRYEWVVCGDTVFPVSWPTNLPASHIGIADAIACWICKEAPPNIELAVKSPHDTPKATF